MCTLTGTATCLLDNVDTKMQMRNVMKHVVRQAPCHRGVQTFSKIAISPGSSQGNLIYQKQNTNSHANTVQFTQIYINIWQEKPSRCLTHCSVFCCLPPSDKFCQEMVFRGNFPLIA